jgi:hypothetical protein
MEKVVAYFTPSNGGTVEKYEMYRIDYNEAVASYPNDWSLEAPRDSKVVDRTPPKLEIVPQQLTAVPLAEPPIVSRVLRGNTPAEPVPSRRLEGGIDAA